MSDIDTLISEFKRTKWASKPFERMVEIVVGNPDQVRGLVEKIVSELPQGGTFLDAALTFMPESEWPALVEYAMDHFDRDHENEAAESILASASLQSPKSMHELLDRLFQNPPNKSSYYASWPWRESQNTHSDFLEQLVLHSDLSESKLEAWRRALESRYEPVLTQFLNLANEVDLNFHLRKQGIHGSVTLNNYLRLVGYEFIEDNLRRLVTEDVYHIIFPPGYMEEDRPWLKPIRHPTWVGSSDETISEVQFGGKGAETCGHCGGTLHNLLSFDSLPSTLGVQSLSKLSLQTCLSCLGWSAASLFYKHDSSGVPQAIGALDKHITPQFPAEPLLVCRASIVKMPRRWFWQDWGLSNSRENLNRVGGEPCWVQDAEYPVCPQCSSTMKFLFQLDSDLPASDGGEWLWGSGGICYGFWCDSCRVSGFSWQCT